MSASCQEQPNPSLGKPEPRPRTVERLTVLFRGNSDAARLVTQLASICDVWDDLIDKDNPIQDADINRAFWISLVDLPANPAYQRFFHSIHPIIANGILNWYAANKFERGGTEQELIHAYVMRGAILDVALILAYLIGGAEWAEAVSPELKMMGNSDTFKQYVEGIKGE